VVSALATPELLPWDGAMVCGADIEGGGKCDLRIARGAFDFRYVREGPPAFGDATVLGFVTLR
jgi:hypothetical protein